MITGDHELVAVATTAYIREIPVCECPALSFEEMANQLAAAPRYDIRSAGGVRLWQDTILEDIPKLIALQRAAPDADPLWHGELVAHLVRHAAPAQPKVLVSQGLVVAAVNGQAEPLRYCGGNLGMCDGPVFIDVRTPTRRADIPLERALRHLELFEPITRARLVLAVEYWFDCKLERGEA